MSKWSKSRPLALAAGGSGGGPGAGAGKLRGLLPTGGTAARYGGGPADDDLDPEKFYDCEEGGDDGEPDPETVTRYSRLPDSVYIPGVPGICSPVACVAGKIGEACSGPNDGATCDSEPDAGDGWCDACAITGGESTENEMFLLLGEYYLESDE